MDTIALILSIIGSLNWGLIGIFRFDLVAWLFGGQTAAGLVLEYLLYTLIPAQSIFSPLREINVFSYAFTLKTVFCFSLCILFLKRLS